MLESVFQLLFRYRPVVFQQGDFRLVPSTGSYVAAALVLLAIAAAVLTYRSARGRGAAMRHRLVLTTLRDRHAGLVLFCLFRPVLVVRAAVSQQNFVGVLIDDSRSMQIADEAGQTRGAIARRAVRARVAADEEPRRTSSSSAPSASRPPRAGWGIRRS